MIPAVLGIASGTFLLLHKDDDTTAPKPDADLPVPLPGLTRKQWLAFLRAAVSGRPDTVSPSFRLGTFGLSVRRLCDLGAMQNPKLMFFGNPPQQVWDAQWKEPRSLRDFQRRPMIQYDLFVRSVKDYADNGQVRDNVNRTVDGELLTFSGVLMLAQRAGLAGMEHWIHDPKVRSRFADNTTAFVKRANRIF